MTSLGENTKKLVSYANVILRLSFEQTQNLLNDLAGVKISDGEISHILEEQARKLLSRNEHLKANIRGQPGAHFDETTYPVQDEEHGKYAWLMTGTESTDAVFQLGQSRGKGNAEKLKGDKNTNQIGISDDYGAYKNLFKHHQLCWAHPLRKLKDLSESRRLTKLKQQHCEKVHQSFLNLYQELTKILAQDFNLAKRQKQAKKLIQQLRIFTKPHPADPEKLHKIKASFIKNQNKYFTCLLHKNIPPTNNKAERALRHLVLKRRASRGSKTQKGAEVMSILHSVLLSLWWRRPKNFFHEYSLLLQNA